MKKYIYLMSDIYNEKNPTNGAIVLKYDTNTKKLSLIDLKNKEEDDVNLSNSLNETLTEYVSKADLENTKSDFVNQIKGFFKIQGSCTLEELNEKEKIEGHWWQVGDKEYVYNGNDWVEIGFNISLEEYAKLTDLPTKVSDLENDKGYLTEETDPVFAAQSGQFALKEELFSQDYNDLNNKPDIPTKVSDLENDKGYLTEETDPVFAAQSGQFALKEELFSQDYNDLNNKPDIPTKVSDLNNDLGFITTYVETDPVYAAQSSQFALKEELFDKNYNSLSNKPEIPEIPSGVSAFANDAGYLTEHQPLTDKADLNSVNYLITKLSKVIKEVDALKRESNVIINSYNPQLLKAENGTLSITDSNVDAIVTSEEIEGKTTLNVKSIEIDNSSVDIEETWHII